MRPRLAIFTRILGLAAPLFAPVFVRAANDYLIVKDLPIIGNQTDIGAYFKGVFQLGMGLAVVFAVLILVVNGVKYMLSDIVTDKGGAKKAMWNAIIGLLIVFGSVLLLNTINPQLTQFNIKGALDKVVNDIPKAPPGGGTGTTPPPGTPKTCAGCVPLSATLAAKTQASCGSKCMLQESFMHKVEGLANNLASANTGWAITEAYPPKGYTDADPTGIHVDHCHGDGTCIDANFRGTIANASSVIAFESAATKAGLHANYEAASQQQADDLKKAGVPYVSYNPGATAAHFHIE